MLKEEQMSVYMPISLLFELDGQESIKKTHRDLVFSYLYMITIFWKYGYYVREKIVLADIKEALGYSRVDKRTNYLFKVGGELDALGYTRVSKNPPMSFKVEDGAIVHEYINDAPREFSKEIIENNINNCIIKEPLFYENGTKYDFKGAINIKLSMFNYFLNQGEDIKQGVSLFYLYSCLMYMSNVNNGEVFACSNETLVKYMGWGLRKVIALTDTLVNMGLIQKGQEKKSKGNVNHYKIL